MLLTEAEYILLTNKLKILVNNQKFPPSFEDDENFHYWEEYTNCYAYAMQFEMFFQSEITKKSYKIYNPGFLSGLELNISDRNNIIDLFLSDCDYLDLTYDVLDRNITLFDLFKCEHTSLRPKKDSYNVGILYPKPITGRYDFHFIRQNNDSTWSEKTRYGGKVHRIEDPLELNEHDLIAAVRVRKIK